jgi:hypothetical protein
VIVTVTVAEAAFAGVVVASVMITLNAVVVVIVADALAEVWFVIPITGLDSQEINGEPPPTGVAVKVTFAAPALVVGLAAAVTEKVVGCPLRGTSTVDDALWVSVDESDTVTKKAVSAFMVAAAFWKFAFVMDVPGAAAH